MKQSMLSLRYFFLFVGTILKLSFIISEFYICISDNMTCIDSSGRSYCMICFVSEHQAFLNIELH